MYLLIYPNNTAHLKSALFLMSAWNVGKAGCPPNVNTIVPNAVKKGKISCLDGWTWGTLSLSSTTLTSNKTHAIAVAIVAPTAIGL